VVTVIARQMALNGRRPLNVHAFFSTGLPVEFQRLSFGTVRLLVTYASGAGVGVELHFSHWPADAGHDERGIMCLEKRFRTYLVYIQI
jgi:hypothetical protein